MIPHFTGDIVHDVVHNGLIAIAAAIGFGPTALAWVRSRR